MAALPEERLFARFRDTGDPEDFAQVYERTVDGLRRCALQLLRDPAAADDAVQQTFLRAIEHADRYQAHRPLQPWLQAILVNETRVLRRLWRRLVSTRSGQLEAIAVASDPPSLVLDAEFRSQVTAAIAGLPERYRPVLRLRLLHGQTNVSIAAALDRPQATVRIQLMRGLQLLRQALPPGCAGLLVLATLPGRITAGSGLPAVDGDVDAPVRVEPGGQSAAWMRPRAGLAAAGAVLAVTVAVRLWTPSAPPPVPVADSVGHGASTAVASEANVPSVALRREPLVVATETGPGVAESALLQVQVRGPEGEAVSGIWVRARPMRVSNPYLHDRWARVDDQGRARFEDLPPGPVEVIGDRGGRVRAPEGAATVTLKLPSKGYTVAGRVVDDAGAPVPGAGVWLSLATDARFGRVVTNADDEGRFVLRGVIGEHYVGSRAVGRAVDRVDRAASWLVRVTGADGDRCPVKLTMDRRCGRVTGRVLDVDGRAVPGAEVIVGTTTDLRVVLDRSGRERTAWSPIRVRADREGGFVVPGVPVGRTSVLTRAPGYFGTAARLRVEGDRDAHATLALHRGGIRGRVTDPSGRPLAGVRVGCTALTEDWLGTGVQTDGRGRFHIVDGHAGHVVLLIDGGAAGHVRRKVFVDPPGEVSCHVEIGDGPPPIRGVLRGPDGGPLRGWTVDVRARFTWRGPDRQRCATTDENGRFRFVGGSNEDHSLYAIPPGACCPCGRGFRLWPRHRDWELRLTAEAMPEAGLRGVVADRAGHRVRDAELTLTRTAWVARTGLYRDHIRVPLRSDGSFLVQGVPPGEYRATVYLEGAELRSLPAMQLRAGRIDDAGTIRVGPVAGRPRPR